MWIKRTKKEKILKLLSSFPAVAIVGPRQIGKTALANKILATHFSKKPIYIDLEMPSHFTIIEKPELYFTQHEDELIIIDEMQRMPKLFPIMRALIDKKRNSGRFLILGSSSLELLRRSSETLTGRVVYEELSGINIIESYKSIKFMTHWLRGGFPMPLLHLTGNDITSWFASFLRNVLEGDLPNLGLKSTFPPLLKLLTIIASQQGGIINVNKYAEILGKSWSNTNEYLDYMENVFLIRRLKPWFTNQKKRVVKSPKCYIRDTGILHYLLGIRSLNHLMTNYIYPFSWEGFAIEQIISCTENAYEYYFYATQDGTECDLILAQSNTPIACIEMKSGETHKITKSLFNSIKDLGTTHNFIVTPIAKGISIINDEYNIKLCNLVDFCTQILPTLKRREQQDGWI